MRRLQVHLFSCVVEAVLIALLLAPAVAQAQAAPWTIVPSPSPGSVNDLNGVASVSATDVWAVGDTNQQTLTEHWNGTAWSVVASPNASSNDALLGVAAVSTTDVWAVGQFISGSNVETLIEQWNGTSWSVVPSPAAGQLRGIAIVSAVSANDIWAVREFTDPNTGTTTTVIEQWNGTAWSVVTSPNHSASDNNLNAAAADPASGQAWAVGAFFSSTSSGLQTLTEFNP
jgi:hypothetical protein